MKRFFCIMLILFTFSLLFTGAEAAADAGGFKPILKDGMAVKSDGTLWRFSEVWNEVTLEKEEEAENVIDFEDEVLQMNLDKHILYILKSDNTFWRHTTTFDHKKGKNKVTNKKIADDVVSIEYNIASSREDAVFMIKKDGSLWGFGSKRAGIPQAKSLFGDGNEEPVPETNPQKLLDNVLMVSGAGDKVFAIKDDYSLWTWGYTVSPQTMDFIDTDAPIKFADGIKYINGGYMIKTDNRELPSNIKEMLKEGKDIKENLKTIKKVTDMLNKLK